MVDTPLESASVALQASVSFSIVILSWPGLISLFRTRRCITTGLLEKWQ